MQVIRKRLWADEGAPAGTRYNQDTDQVETTPDGGLTWNPDPGSDPRSNPAYQLPPSPDGNCAAAAGMVVQMKIFVEGMADATLIGVANVALLMLVTMIPGAGWLFGVALAVASGVLAAGTGVIAASFTPTVWDQILCILYCHIAPDGTVNQEQLDAIQTAIDDECGGTVSAGTAFMWQTWGFVGLSNAGVINADPLADCSSCSCPWCYTWDFTLDPGDWVASTYGTWVAGEGWQLTPTPSAIVIQQDFLAANSMRSCEVETSNSGGSGVQALYWNDGSLHLLGTTSLAAGNSTTFLFSATTTADVPNIVYNANADNGATVYLRRLTIRGDFDPNPIGTDNC